MKKIIIDAGNASKISSLNNERIGIIIKSIIGCAELGVLSKKEKEIADSISSNSAFDCIEGTQAEGLKSLTEQAYKAMGL
ncbi:MAG: hypothetical protein ACRC4W_02235 [Treponemataceae bacterium]